MRQRQVGLMVMVTLDERARFKAKAKEYDLTLRQLVTSAIDCYLGPKPVLDRVEELEKRVAALESGR